MPLVVDHRLGILVEEPENTMNSSALLLLRVETASRLRADRSVDRAQWWRAPHLVPCAVAAIVGVAISVSCWFAASVREDRLADLDLSARANSHAMVLQGEIADYL